MSLLVLSLLSGTASATWASIILRLFDCPWAAPHIKRSLGPIQTICTGPFSHCHAIITSVQSKNPWLLDACDKVLRTAASSRAVITDWSILEYVHVLYSSTPTRLLRRGKVCIYLKARYLLKVMHKPKTVFLQMRWSCPSIVGCSVWSHSLTIILEMIWHLPRLSVWHTHH